MSKRDKLIKLRSKIIDAIFKERWKDVWFFPGHDGVRGYLGTKDILFLSINPSTGGGVFPDKFVGFYYEQLKKNGFANAHLTDVFKQRHKNWQELAKDKKLKREAIDFLRKEIRIIRPKLIVCVGKTYKKFYENILNDVDVKKITIAHYAPRFNNDKKRQLLIQEIRGVEVVYKNI